MNQVDSSWYSDGANDHGSERCNDCIVFTLRKHHQGDYRNSNTDTCRDVGEIS